MIKLFKNILRVILKIITIPVFILSSSVICTMYLLSTNEDIPDLYKDLYHNFFDRFEEKG